jgi:hypothetical protein
MLSVTPTTYSAKWLDDSEYWLRKDVEGAVVVWFKVLSRNLTGGTEENTKNINSLSDVTTRKTALTTSTAVRTSNPASDRTVGVPTEIRTEHLPKEVEALPLEPTSSVTWLSIIRYLFIYGIFDNARNISGYIASNDRMTKWTGKDVEGNDHDLIWVPIRHVAGENQETPNDSPILGPDVNPGPPEHETGVLTTRWRMSYVGLFFFQFLGVGWDWVHLVRRPPFGLLYQPRMIDDERGVVGGMRIGRGNRSTWRKPAPVLLCPPQIPHDLTWDWTRAAAVGSRQLHT